MTAGQSTDSSRGVSSVSWKAEKWTRSRWIHPNSAEIERHATTNTNGANIMTTANQTTLLAGRNGQMPRNRNHWCRGTLKTNTTTNVAVNGVNIMATGSTRFSRTDTSSTSAVSHRGMLTNHASPKETATKVINATQGTLRNRSSRSTSVIL